MRLLLAEDEKEMSNAITAVLKHEHYSVDAVYDGQDAFDYLDTGLYDGAILDIMMPKKDGITVLKEIRRKGNDIPVILLTAKSELDDKVEGLDAGADDYLTKPFAGGELLARLRALLRRKGEFQSDVIKYGDLELDRTSYTLSCGTKNVKLVGKAYQLMEMLIRSPHQILSVNQLMEHVWGWDSEAEINVVWVNISFLRKKLTEIGSKTEIRATRGVGYSLE